MRKQLENRFSIKMKSWDMSKSDKFRDNLYDIPAKIKEYRLH